MKSLEASSLISSKMFLNAAHPSSPELPAGTIIVLRFLLTDASETYQMREPTSILYKHQNTYSKLNETFLKPIGYPATQNNDIIYVDIMYIMTKCKKMHRKYSIFNKKKISVKHQTAQF